MAEYRVGIIGCGRIGSQWEGLAPWSPSTIAGAFAALPECRIVAGCNRGRERLEEFGRKWNVAALYHDFREMLARERLDIVGVATHPPLHPEIVVAAAEIGVRGIFCEKPLALSVGECRRMIEACDRHCVALLVNCTRRWSGECEAVRRIVQDAQRARSSGTEHSVLRARGSGTDHSVLSTQYPVLGTPSPPTEPQPSFAVPSPAPNARFGRLIRMTGHCCGCKPTPQWVADTEGPLLHDAVHLIDLMRFFAGDVRRLWGTATCRHRPALRVEDSSYAVLEFASGVTGVLLVDELTEYERWEIELEFERGLVRLGFGGGVWTSRMQAFEQPWWHELSPAAPIAPAWTAPPMLLAARGLVHAVESGEPPRSSGRDGLAAVEVIMAIYESQLTGNRWIDLPLGRDERMIDVLRQAGLF